jgi:uncharacterized protein (DUF934 family)
MPKLIKNNAVIEDNWSLVKEAATVAELPAGKVIVPLALWHANKAELLARGDVGVWLASADSAAVLKDDLTKLPLIAVNFPAFTDGRGYSIARILRDHFKYQGEIRAVGDVLRDQLFYMKRSGFDAFSMRENDKSEQALQSLNDFSNSYQAGADDARPLFNRRA